MDRADAVDVGPLCGSCGDQVLDAAEPVEQRSGGTDRNAGHGREKAGRGSESDGVPLGRTVGPGRLVGREYDGVVLQERRLVDYNFDDR